MLLSVQNHLFGATLCHSSGMRQCYMNFYLKIQIYSYPIRLFNSQYYEFALFSFHVRNCINLKSVFWIHCTPYIVCTAGLNINDYVKCTIKSTFQNKLLFANTMRLNVPFKYFIHWQCETFRYDFSNYCAFKRVICQMEMSFLRY